MDYHAITRNGVYLIHSDDMGKYDKIDPAAVTAQRRADIKAGKPLLPKQACHFCGYSVPRLALWCSSECAVSHANERAELAAPPDGA